MKRILIYIGIAGLLTGNITSCSDYLDTETPSHHLSPFMFSSESTIWSLLVNVYTKAQTGDCLSDRIVMNLNGVGSDIELRPDLTSSGRGALINLYPAGPEWDNNDAGRRQWNSSYAAINMANEVIAGIDTYYPEIKSATTPSTLSHMYGEAKVLRGVLYLEMVRNFGDVPLMLEPSYGDMDLKIPVSDRWVVLDAILEDLEKVAPLMFWASELPQKAERVNKGFCYGLIAKLALTRGGYSLHAVKSEPANWGETKRDESNWQKYYQQANAALKKLVAGGKHSLITTDSRGSTGNGDKNNPFQLVFQNQMDYVISDESLWEVSMAREYGGNWGYAYNRFHTGGNNANVSKAFGAIRFTPTYYYSFDDKDLRRDVTATITGTKGGGDEIMTVPGGVGDGAANGITLNKWDKMRMENVYNLGSGKAGINFVYMRYAEALLLLAETEAVLGGSDAKTYLKQVRRRAFRTADHTAKVDNYVDALTGDALLQAIKDEMSWELGGENVRKHNLIRWGEFSKAIIDARKALQTMANNIRSQGYHTYPNGKQISDVVYIKQIRQAAAPAGFVVGTTYGTPAGSTEPVLTPGWRGVGDASKFSVAPAYVLAIKGLDRHLTPAEIAALKADGYTEATWGKSFLNGDKYSSYIGNGPSEGWWGGYMETDYNAGKQARYLCAIPGSVISATGKDADGKNILVNYYGFLNAAQ